MIFQQKLSSIIATTVVVLMSHYRIDTVDAQSSWSAQCASEQKAIESNKAVLEAANISDVKDSDGLSDYDTTLAGKFKDVCLNAGGQFVTADIMYNCYAFGPIDYVGSSKPFCFGSICTESEIMEYMDETFIAETKLTLLVEGILCEIQYSNLMRVGAANSSSDAGSWFHFNFNDYFYVIPSLMFVVIMAL